MNNIDKLNDALRAALDEVGQALRTGQDVSRFVSISQGNNKMGKVASVSLLPILTCPARCNGTCGEKCYAKKLAILRPTVARAYARNTAVARLAPEVFLRVVDNAMRSARYFRFHVSGDLPDYDYLLRVVWVCMDNPHCEVLMFTKRFELVNRYIEQFGSLPRNLHCLFSGWTNLRPTDDGLNPNGLPETTVYASEADIRPEWTLCGGNCLDCAIHEGGCWAAKPGETIAFTIH